MTHEAGTAETLADAIRKELVDLPLQRRACATGLLAELAALAKRDTSHPAAPHQAVVQTLAATDVLAERARQISAEGWTPEHDAGHGAAQLAAAAGCYALFTDSYPNAGEPPRPWPWEDEAWKPKDFRRDLVRSAALALAAIEANDSAVRDV